MAGLGPNWVGSGELAAPVLIGTKRMVGRDTASQIASASIASCEQAHQQLKEELGLDHFEGRSWQLF